MLSKTDFDSIISKAELTKDDKEKLAPYRVKRAVLMAAGLGTRLRPLTYDTPKPLVKVGGTRIIDTILDALIENGITEIYIVRGYLQDQFDVLLEKYPSIKFLNNFSYSQGNNILSAFLAGNLICNAFVMPADIYINNSKVFYPYQWRSNVLGYKVESTDDWCIETSDGVIKRLSIGGDGDSCYKDTGIFYWNDDDGNKLYKQIAEVTMIKKEINRYWSNVAFEIYKSDYHVLIRECEANDVIEIDTYEELCKIAPEYRR